MSGLLFSGMNYFKVSSLKSDSLVKVAKNDIVQMQQVGLGSKT